MPILDPENYRFSGSEPYVGTFDCRVDSSGEDWCIFIMTAEGQRIERYCSTWQEEPCIGLTKVYEILREYGFILAGKGPPEIEGVNWPSDLQRLIDHCAVLGTEWPDTGDFCGRITTSRYSLPDHLQEAITKAEEDLVR